MVASQYGSSERGISSATTLWICRYSSRLVAQTKSFFFVLSWYMAAFRKGLSCPLSLHRTTSPLESMSNDPEYLCGSK